MYTKIERCSIALIQIGCAWSGSILAVGYFSETVFSEAIFYLG